MLRAEDERMWVAEFDPLLHSPAPDGIFDSRRCSSVLKPKGQCHHCFSQAHSLQRGITALQGLRSENKDYLHQFTKTTAFLGPLQPHTVDFPASAAAV